MKKLIKKSLKKIKIYYNSKKNNFKKYKIKKI